MSKVSRCKSFEVRFVGLRCHNVDDIDDFQTWSNHLGIDPLACVEEGKHFIKGLYKLSDAKQILAWATERGITVEDS